MLFLNSSFDAKAGVKDAMSILFEQEEQIAERWHLDPKMTKDNYI